MGPATVGMDEWMDGGMGGKRNGWMDEMGVYEALLQNLLELTYA